MKTKVLSYVAVFVLLAVMAGCSNGDAVLNTEKETAANKENADLTAFASADAPNTRTSLDYHSGAFFWEDGDHIYVKDDGNDFKKSSNFVSGTRQAHFKFMMPGTYASNSYTVYYPGADGVNDQVTIAAEQTQTEPNNNTHFGKAGDCGLGKAIKNASGQFDFTLEHKASYLCFLPSTSHTLVSTYITKIEVSSDNNIAGSYTLDAVGNKLTGSGNGKTITLTTKGSGDYADGFPLNKNNTSLVTNRAFMVIAPGYHKLTVKYYIRDVQTNVEGVIVKKLKAFNYVAREYYDIASKLDVKVCDDKYYMWDAQDEYWAGHKAAQPKKNGVQSSGYPKASDVNRWYNKVNYPTPASQSAKNCPNVNVCIWYCLKGDPHWDNTTLWTTWGHLYVGGMWFKKASVIASENGKASAAELKKADPLGRDLATKKLFVNMPNNNQIASGTPINSSNYFFLPAAGYYSSGKLEDFGTHGRYWSCTPEPFFSGRAYYLYFYNGDVVVGNIYERDGGFQVWRTE
ncbi:lipoprotein [Hoylesella pleuritidis]|jgi:lipoprotein|uniref:Putative lipoprotein n=1 Tax=Hoylesella pleuritidis F0068 TaxID=1081904 RepID=U2MPM8_9BACT|nr:lipoprotein [Hoylesella pleuritidis]ERK03605.1 putative lipoprotein [Hoylesella pleuritidis F0068]